MICYAYFNINYLASHFDRLLCKPGYLDMLDAEDSYVCLTLGRKVEKESK